MLNKYQSHPLRSLSLFATVLFSCSVYAGDLVNEQLAIEQKMLDQQIAVEQMQQLEQAKIEQQQSDEQKLNEQFPHLELLFKSKIAKIYADNQYQPLWNNEKVVRQFLYDYSALAITGVSKSSWAQLVKLEAAPLNSLERDILLTDSFLDYLYYADNLNQFAQKWLYDNVGYTTSLPKEERIEAWLAALKQSKDADFLNSLSNHNRLYNQTLASLPQYLANLNDKNAVAKLYKMAANVQRLRVIPEFENGIFVNIPSYKLYYFRGGELVLDSKVIVGKKERKTPVMYSKLSNVVVNPPWNAPVRLINEDIIPKVRKDPSYIYRNGYTIIDSKGRTIDPYTIDWENMTAKKFPYRLRQVPGDSALGDFKFNMPSSDAIYLHDTPNRSYFAKKNLALSSGCVRVEQSNKLATILLKESGWTEERKNNTLKSRKTVSVNISSDNPVFLYYVTHWIDKGVEQSLPDIYGYDRVPNLSHINWDIIKKYLN